MEIKYDDKIYTLIEDIHMEVHDSIGCMSCIASDEWAMAKAVDSEGKIYELWWKAGNTADLKSVISSEPDDIIDENGKYIK